MRARVKSTVDAHDASGPAVRLIVTEYEVVGLPIVSPTFAFRDRAERWLAEQLAKMPAHSRPRERSCLCCSASFASDGRHHRLCKACRHKDGGPLYSRAAIPDRRLRSLG